MAVREFSDAGGRSWRAWDIRPESIHPQTKAEDYLTDCFVIGWVVFETTAGDEKRRLCPYPARWATGSDEELCALLGRAEAVPPRKLLAERQTAGETVPGAVPVKIHDVEDKPDVTDLCVVRTFRFPGGRLWTVGEMTHPEDGGPPVLRFTAGRRIIDLKTWPKDWADAPDERLVDMLRVAGPPRAMSTAKDPYRRESDRSSSDQRSDGPT